MTSVKVGDLQGAIEIAERLKENKEFYDLCSETSLKRFNSFYTEDAWKKNWNETNK